MNNRSYTELQFAYNLAVITTYHTQYAAELLATADISLLPVPYIEQWFSTKQATDQQLRQLLVDKTKIRDEMRRRRALVGFM